MSLLSTNYHYGLVCYIFKISTALGLLLLASLFSACNEVATNSTSPSQTAASTAGSRENYVTARRIPYRQVREQARQRLAGAQQTYRLTKFTYSSPSPTEPRFSFRRDQKGLKLCRGLRQTHRWNFASITERGKIGSCSIRRL